MNDIFKQHTQVILKILWRSFIVAGLIYFSLATTMQLTFFEMLRSSLVGAGSYSFIELAKFYNVDYKSKEKKEIKNLFIPILF